MIKTKAILRESGRAFIEDDGKFFHIAPPYTLDTRIQVAENDIEEATSGYGFELDEKEFNNYSKLCSYLIQEYDRWRIQKNLPDRTLSDAERLQNMPAPMIKVFIKELRKKYDQGLYLQVQTMGELMLNNIYAAQIPEEMESLKAMIENCKSKRHHALSNVFVNLIGISGSNELESLYTTESLRLKVA